MAQDDAIVTLISGSSNTNAPLPLKKKRNLPGNPDPEAEVLALSPNTLMTTNRFVCEVCGKGFPRDQNLQLHRRGHNLPWKLKQRSSKEVRKRVYVCPEKSCVHHHPSRALGDLTGIKKHFCRKHGDKKWKCDKCSKKYAVQSDWKAHSKTCGTREYRCDCGTVFSRRDSFITHRAFCDALAEETARINAASQFNLATAGNGSLSYNFMGGLMAPQQHFSSLFKPFPITKDDPETQSQTQKGPTFPLWIMSQDPQPALISSHNMVHQTAADMNQQVGLPSMNNVFYTSPQSVVSCSDPQQQQQQQQQQASNSYQMNWFLGDSNTSLPLMNTNNTTVSVPSIYSTQHQEPSSSAHMSATALLQKAAQIGATTTTDPTFLGSGGELGGYGSNSTTTNVVGSDVESTENVFSTMSSNNNNNINQVDMLFSDGGNKRRRVMQASEQQDQYYHHQPYHYHHHQEEEGGQTRDFLGVGVESICHPPPISGWI